MRHTTTQRHVASSHARFSSSMRDVDYMPPRLSQTRTADYVLYTALHDETKSCILLHDAARASLALSLLLAESLA